MSAQLEVVHLVAAGDALAHLLNDGGSGHERCHAQARSMGKPVEAWCSVCAAVDYWKEVRIAVLNDGQADG